MTNFALVALSVCLCVAAAVAAPAGDEVMQLPGLMQELNFRQYSGYLQASGSKKLHYWFVESENKPSHDPVVLWMNGGPGCSSDLGLLTEHGPFTVQDDGTSLKLNPHSWNLVANVLYLEAPAGVGFSYSDDGNYTTNDNITAYDNYLALKDFFSKFPEYRANQFFVTGESYGGVYVPSLSVLVLRDPAFNFQGFAVGNGLSSAELNDDSTVYYAYFHGLIGETAWNNLVKTCCDGTAKGCSFSKNAQTMQMCAEYLNEVRNLVWTGDLNVYNLYSPCYHSATTNPSLTAMQTAYDPLRSTLKSANFGWSFAHLPAVKKEREWMSKLGRVGVSPPCIKVDGAVRYMNQASVRRALHIPQGVQEWQPCSAIDYQRTEDIDMSPYYREVLAKQKRVLVYNGDADMACNFLGDEWFVDRLNLKVVRPRGEWTYVDQTKNKQVAGFAKTFQDLTFVTVKGAGHMVPTDKPGLALQMFINFLSNKPFH